MGENESSFIESLKKQVIVFFVSSAFLIIGTAVGFYYNTSFGMQVLESKQAQLDIHNSEMQKKIYELDSKKIEKNDYIRETQELKEMIRDLSRKIEKLSDK